MSDIDERDCQHGLADTEQDIIESLRQRVMELEEARDKYMDIADYKTAELAALKQAQGEPVATVEEKRIVEHVSLPIGTDLYTSAPTIPEGGQAAWKIAQKEQRERDAEICRTRPAMLGSQKDIRDVCADAILNQGEEE